MTILCPFVRVVPPPSGEKLETSKYETCFSVNLNVNVNVNWNIGRRNLLTNATFSCRRQISNLCFITAQRWRLAIK